MRNLMTVLLMVLTAYVAAGQTETRIASTIQGKIVNSITNEPVAYANIGVEDTFFGTASDEDGNFQLKIPEEMVSAQIFFSSVGFQRKNISISSLINKEFNIIKLEPQTYDIDNIDVEGRSLVLERILRMASENTPYNFISGPVNFNCTLNHEKITHDSIKQMRQSEVLIYDKTGYRSPSKTDAYRMRTYEIKAAEPDYSFASGILHLDEVLHTDWVRNGSSVLNPALTGQFELALEGEPTIDGKPAWVISFSQANPTPEGSQDFHATAFQGEIIVFKEDYSVKQVKVSAKSDKHHRQGKFLAVGTINENYYENVDYQFQITYSKLKPEKIEISKSYIFNGEPVQEHTELLVHTVQVENVKEIARRGYFAD